MKNRVTFLLTLSDVFTWGVFIVLSAIGGIYLSQKLNSDAVQIVGIGTATYLFTRAIFNIPIGYITDKISHDRDEIIALVLGNILMGAPYMFFPLITNEYFYYFLMFVFGIGTSLNLINWRKLFALNMEQDQEGKEYGRYDTILAILSGLLALSAGTIANISPEYFDLAFLGFGALMSSSFIWVALIFRIKKRRSR